MLTPEHKETGLIFDRDLLTMADKDVDLFDNFFLFSGLKRVLEGQRFASAEEVNTKATRALTEASKNGLQKCFQKHQKRWQNCVTTQGS
jgi:hypothetical protein